MRQPNCVRQLEKGIRRGRGEVSGGQGGAGEIGGTGSLGTGISRLIQYISSRYNASLQQVASPVAEASVITPATPLIQRDYKKTIRVAALFPLAGIMLGFGVALLREGLSGRVFLTSKSVQSRLRIACVGLLPKIRQGKRVRFWAKQAQSGAASRTLVRGDREISWTVVDYPFSRFSEGLRSMKLAIDLENRSKSARVVELPPRLQTRESRLSRWRSPS